MLRKEASLAVLGYPAVSLTSSPRPGMSPESLPSFWDIGVFRHSLSYQYHVSVNVVSMTKVTDEGKANK